MQQGRCANYDGDHVMFTASYNKGYDTYIWNGDTFSRQAEPEYDHYDGGLIGYEIDGKKGQGSSNCFRPSFQNRTLKRQTRSRTV